MTAQSTTNQPSPSFRLLALLLAVVMLTTALSASPLTPAAEASSSTITGTATWRDCTNVSLPGCAGRGTLANGTAVQMHCWIDDSTVTERYRSPRWFYVSGPNAVRGFVHSSRVVNQTRVGHCGSHRGIAPARWAATKVGSTTPTSTEARGTGADRWSGWCYLFASDAHIFGYNNTPLTGYGSAKATFNEYRRRGLVSTDLNTARMPIGALVFWTFGSDGHAAVYVGNGYVVSTQGDGSKKLPIARLKLSHWNGSGAPVGWVAPSKV
jgi:hypothetical protein